jgi:HSP20 family protein
MLKFPWKPFRLLGNLDDQNDQAFDELIHHQWDHSPPSETWPPEGDDHFQPFL